MRGDGGEALDAEGLEEGVWGEGLVAEDDGGGVPWGGRGGEEGVSDGGGVGGVGL